MRTVNLSIHENVNIHDPKLQQAIGYMSTWANADLVELFIDRDSHITGHYYRCPADTPKKHFYTIGGIRAADGSYSFHS